MSSATTTTTKLYKTYLVFCEAALKERFCLWLLTIWHVYAVLSIYHNCTSRPHRRLKIIRCIFHLYEFVNVFNSSSSCIKICCLTFIKTLRLCVNYPRGNCCFFNYTKWLISHLNQASRGSRLLLLGASSPTEKATLWTPWISRMTLVAGDLTWTWSSSTSTQWTGLLGSSYSAFFAISSSPLFDALTAILG